MDRLSSCVSRSVWLCVGLAICVSNFWIAYSARPISTHVGRSLAGSTHSGCAHASTGSPRTPTSRSFRPILRASVARGPLAGPCGPRSCASAGPAAGAVRGAKKEGQMSTQQQRCVATASERRRLKEGNERTAAAATRPGTQHKARQWHEHAPDRRFRAGGARPSCGAALHNAHKSTR